MYELMYFLHLTGVAIWVGAFIAFGLLLRSLVKSKQVEAQSSIVNQIRRWVNIGIIPSGLIVLVTGVLMIVQFSRDALPMYMILMEQIGSLVILGSVIAISIYSFKLKKQMQAHSLNDVHPVKKHQSLAHLTSVYSKLLFSSAGLAIVVIVVVSLRIT